MILHIFFLWSLQLQGGKWKHQCSDDPCGNSDVQPYIKYSIKSKNCQKYILYKTQYSDVYLYSQKKKN